MIGLKNMASQMKQLNDEITQEQAQPDSFALLKPVEHKAANQAPEFTEGQPYWPFFPNSMMYKEVFDDFTSGLALVSLEGRTIAINNMFSYLTEYREERASESLLMLYNSAQKVVFDFEYLKPLLNYPTPFSYTQVEINLSESETEARWISLHIGLIRNKQRRPLYFVIECQDIQPYKNQIAQLEHQVMHDSLTGLANRRLLEHDVTTTLALARRNQKKFAIVTIDVDKFKQINDTLGHDNGDALLKTVASRLRNAVRISDTVARIGGDEFVILLNEVKNLAGVESVAQKIIHLFKNPISLNEHTITITVSVGISIYPEGGQDYENLYKNADIALYQVKENGRGHYCIFHN